MVTNVLFPEMAEPSRSRDVAVRADEDRLRRSAIGQFLTPPPIADFMASLFASRTEAFDLLDAGAGTGALTHAFVRQACAKSRRPDRISVTAYELDASVIGDLRNTLKTCAKMCERAKIDFQSVIHNEDFISSVSPAVGSRLFGTQFSRFNVAIVNPPYRKIQSDSHARRSLRKAGIETSNLYTGFIALITRLLSTGGELVAITPRSFCNGPYFRMFRTDFLRSMSLRRLHVFDSRSAAFAGDGVLQENIVFHAMKGKKPPRQVVISSSSGEPGGVILARGVDYHDVVSPGDPQQFIHLETDDRHRSARDMMNQLSCSLADLGISVSTGRVVDFRAKEFLRTKAQEGTVPLIYPCHFNGAFVVWPRLDGRKPNALVSNRQTRNLLVPQGVYVLVKRFTTKEERRRVVASIYDSAKIPSPLIGIENHLNYFHARGAGLNLALAKGLAAFLNSTIVDDYFRQFSGHTQVNSTDLRSLKYPSKAALERLGHNIAEPDQVSLDAIVERELF